jgi:hypothetical protein
MDETHAADTGDGSWMTYGQLAEARQIGRRAAVRLAQRHRLRRQPGNDGSVRVWVPADMAASSPFRPHPPATPATPDDADADDTPAADATPFHAQALAALEDALRLADARADAALALANKLTAALADAGVRTEWLATERDAMRERAAFAQAAVERAQEQAKAAQARVDELRQAEEARKGQGRWVRLRAAWRAE